MERGLKPDAEVSKFRHSKAGKATIIGLAVVLVLNFAGSVLPNRKVEAAEPSRLEKRVFDDEVLRVKRDENTVYFDIETADFDKLSVHGTVYEVDDFSKPVSNFGNPWDYPEDGPLVERVQEAGESLLRLNITPQLSTWLVLNADGFYVSDYSQLVVNMDYDANNPVLSMFGSAFIPSTPITLAIDTLNSENGMDEFYSSANVTGRKDYVFPLSSFVSEDTGAVLEGDFIQYLKLFANHVPQEAPLNIYSVQFRDEGQLVQAENGTFSWSQELEPGQTAIQLSLFGDNQEAEVDIPVASIPEIAFHAPVINDFYFTSHPATLMQGVTAKDKIFTMPLNGVLELGAVMGTDADGDALEWSVQSNNSAVEAYIQNSTLFIAADDSHWTGDTSVTVTLTDEGGLEDKVNVPVVVFGTDKTRVNGEGKKEYFIPWGVQLDINRILSVEEHMRQYDKEDLGLLDRTLRFSQFKVMEYFNGPQAVGWLNENTYAGWSQVSQFLFVDATFTELSNLGCDSISLWREYYLKTMSSYPVANYTSFPVTMTDKEMNYFIDEAHYRGFKIIVTPQIRETFGFSRDPITPPSIFEWFNLYEEIVNSNAEICQQTGVESFVMGNILYMPTSIARGLLSNSQWNNFMIQINESSKEIYSGPTIYMPGSFEGGYKNGGFIDILPLLRSVDIVGGNANFINYLVSNDPTLAEVEGIISMKIEQLIDPVFQTLDKPMLLNEGGVLSLDASIRNADLIGIAPENGTYDGQEQAIWYEALFSAMKVYPYIFGLGWSFWSLFPEAGGTGDLGITPRLKPAEQSISEAYGANYSPVINIDGDFSDWKQSMLIYSGNQGASTSEHPIISSLLGTQDKDYYYLDINLSEPIDNNYILQVLFDVNQDGKPDFDGPILYQGDNQWHFYLLNDVNDWSNIRGMLDFKGNTNFSRIEARIPKNFLLNLNAINVYVGIFNKSLGKKINETPFLPIK